MGGGASRVHRNAKVDAGSASDSDSPRAGNAAGAGADTSSDPSLGGNNPPDAAGTAGAAAGSRPVEMSSPKETPKGPDEDAGKGKDGDEGGEFDEARTEHLIGELRAYQSLQVYEQSRIILDSAIRLIEKGEAFFFDPKNGPLPDRASVPSPPSAYPAAPPPPAAGEEEDDASVQSTGAGRVPSPESFDYMDDDDDEYGITELTPDNATEFLKRAQTFAFPTDAPVTIEKSWGLVSAAPGDYVVANPHGDLYCVPKERFERFYSAVSGAEHKYQKVEPVLGRRMMRDFTITLDDGSEMSGKEGDFLVQDREGEQWIVSGDTFHETYEPSILSQHNWLLDTMAKQSERGLPQDSDDPLASVYLGRKRREEMTELLEGTANEWDFDVFELQRITHGHPLFHLGSYLFEAHGLVGSLGVKPDTFAQFLLQCESQYHANPYHNSTHAADVLQCVSYFLLHTDMMAQLPNEEVFTLMISAVVSSIAHPGTDNHFQTRSRSQLALFYNDQHVLQHFHCAKTFQLLQKGNCDITATLPRETQLTFRRTLITLLLGLDLDDAPRLHRAFAKRRQLWYSLEEREEAFGSDPLSRWKARGGSMMRPAALVETRRGPTAFGSTLGTRDGTVLASLAEREEEEEEETEPRDGWEGEDDADDASTSTEGSRGSAGAGAGAKENQARGASAVPQSGDSPRWRSPRANGSGAAKGHSEGGLSAGAAAARADAERAAAEAGPGGDVKFDEESEPDRMLVMTTTLVCGEVAYATKSRLMHDKWAVKVEEEWKAQADKERTAGIPATDVSQQQNAKRHLHNIRQVAKPLYTEFCAQFGQKQLLMNINLNANHWNKRLVSLGATHAHDGGELQEGAAGRGAKPVAGGTLRVMGTLFGRRGGGKK